MGDWPAQVRRAAPLVVANTDPRVSPFGAYLAGISPAAAPAAITPGANNLVSCEVDLPEPMSVQWFAWRNGVSLSNVALSLYDRETLARVASTGSVAQVGSSAFQAASVAAVPVPAGRYLVGLACDSTNTVYGYAGSAAEVPLWRVLGITQMAASFAAPSTWAVSSYPTHVPVVSFGGLATVT